MRALRYIVPVLLWTAMTIALVMSNDRIRTSSHARIHEKLAVAFIFAGVASAIAAIVLALARQPSAISFGIFAIIHGVALPFLLWPSTVQFYGAGLIIPAISVVVGLRAMMMQVRQKKL